MIFAIETSCDETSVAILSLKGKILSHITVNQENHNKFGGVVPEIASRAHLQILQKNHETNSYKDPYYLTFLNFMGGLGWLIYT